MMQDKDKRLEPPAGSVTLVGAGCGRGLLTARARRALQNADAVIYDDLVDPEVLENLPEKAEQIYVGKRYGRHSQAQPEINRLLIDMAKQGLRVVRLKGGDSFIFGRGGEEYLALRDAGIPCQVIPGISSCIAVPENAGIPLTHRGVARSFTVVTGHSADGTGEDYSALARLRGTLVFLMGLHALPQIAGRLMANGKDPDTPAAVISRGFQPDEQRIDGTLGTIAELARDAKTPAVIVVGETARFHMCGTVPQPLAGARVCITGSSSFSRRMREMLEPLGAFTSVLRTLEIVPDASAIPSDFRPYSWLVFTSSNGVEIFFHEMARQDRDLRSLASVKFACIGDSTARTLRSHGFHADLVPPAYTSEALGNELAAALQARGAGNSAAAADPAASGLDSENPLPSERDRKVLILRAAEGSAALPEALARAGIAFEDRGIYSTRISEGGKTGEWQACDYLVFASAGGVNAFFAHHGALPARITPVCIGPLTAAGLKAHDNRPCLVADTYTAGGIAEAIRRDWMEKKK